ncbi:hypothetical protein [Peribacillus tepidiphilus]|uniref:hypothetical protein n=1 Tax=Peribacillus tepidiphilus TaxID=2652445 RepID=UPI0012911FB8|nr:hypothetical protein [Peribacillus tepidiphilus]
MIDHEFFLSNFLNKKREKIIQFARVGPNYSGGRPRLIFDGETVVSGKAYPYLASYTPAANDRVMLVKGVIIGKIV